MKNILILFLFLFLLSCNSTAEKEVETVKANVAEVVSNNAFTKRDTIPPANIRTVTSMEKARPVSEINKSFPFDIALKDAKGQLINSADALPDNGKPTVLLFWLTTCPPCAREMQAISEKYSGWKEETDFNLVAISTDFSKNYPNFVKRVEDKNWPWSTYHDVHREFRKVMPGGLNGLPQTFILDGNGEVVYHKRKYSTGDEDKLYDKVKSIAAK
ncbi:MAG: TlpA family protein disulfide reductase [Saprospiraceae bacterium]